jgi:glucuronate isomerase
LGCRLSDHALGYVPFAIGDAEAVFNKRMSGEVLTTNEADIYKTAIITICAEEYSRLGFAMQIHIGALRNNNKRMFEKLGADTGFDSISDKNSISLLSRLMDRLNSENALPKLILFNLNPKMNEELMTLLGCFQDGETRGKIQYGPAWWFLDNKVGMEKHLRDLTATGHIGAFVGMLTDSRSLLSYPRHHYFRRILCSYLGALIENGEMTDNLDLVGEVIKDVCYNNAINYFKI